MNKKETLALWAQGRDAWNDWAKEMLARRAKLEKAGEWDSSRKVGGGEAGNNNATQAWMQESRSNSKNHNFFHPADFSDFVFPYDVTFSRCSYNKRVDYSGCRFHDQVDFTDTVCREDTYLSNAQCIGRSIFKYASFHGDLLSRAAEFHDTVDFSDASFRGGVNFVKTRFHRDASFKKTTFLKDVWFEEVCFSNLHFNDALFSASAWFLSITFKDNAVFDRSKFDGFTSFDRARFQNAASFEAIMGNSSFSLAGAHFSEAPNFIQAHFTEAPRLDDLRVERKSDSEDAPARYRALKRLAIQAHDHEREQEFFACELKALRGVYRELLRNPVNLFRRDEDGRRRRAWRGGGHFCLGVLYEVLCDFGRSMLRPFVWLLATGIGCAWAYLGAHFARSTYGVSSGAWLLGRLGERVADLLRWLASGFPPEAALRDIAGWLGRLLAPSAPMSPLTCIAGDQTDPLSAAIGLSVRKALPIAGVASCEKLNQIYACLYGTLPGSESSKGFTPLIPDGVDGLGIFQLLLSLVLLFLFALAVRNHFRIR